VRARAKSDDTKPIRILAVDDHALPRQCVASLIADEPDMTLVAKAANGREAIEQHDGTYAAMIGLKRAIIEL
jgi:DNA-binding NarL/FixJ family response regulator